MARARSRGLGRISPELSFSRSEDDDTVRIYAIQNGEHAGHVVLLKDTMPGALVASTIHVVKDERAGGIGTRLYEKALEESCARGEALVSDSMRSRYAEAFWRKQARKRRAVCLEKGRASVYHAPLRDLYTELLIDCKRKHYGREKACADARFRATTALLPRPRDVTADSHGVWPCYRWGFRKSACGVSLEGVPFKRPWVPLLILFALPFVPP